MGLIVFILSNFYPFLYDEPLVEFKQWIEQDSISINYGVRLNNPEKNSIQPFVQYISDTLTHTTAGFTGRLSKNNLSIFFTPVVSTGNGRIYPDKKWKNKISGGFINSGINFKTKNLSLLIGNTRVVFTTSPFNSPILSLDTPPIPMLSYTLKFGGLTITQITGYLGFYSGTLYAPDVNPSDTVDINRYLLIHRFSLRPYRNLGLGFTEISIAGYNGGFDPTILNPIGIYYVKQFNLWSNVNIIWNFDAVLKIKKTILYANLLIDDFQYEEDPWNEPAHMGINTGIIHKINNYTFVLEYNRFTRWVYGHFYVWQRYTYGNYPLGMEPASDFENLILKIGRGILSFDFEYRNRGETSPFTSWPVDYTQPQGSGNSFPENNFLSGVVERNASIRLSLLKKFNNYELFTQAGVLYSKNHGHISGENKVFPVFLICLKGIFKIPMEEK